MKIRLSNLEVYTSMDRSTCQVVNARREIADIIYSQGAGLGLAGLALATKMWNGDDDTEYGDEEAAIVRSVVEKSCAPCLIQAVADMLDAASAVQEGTTDSTGKEE